MKRSTAAIALLGIALRRQRSSRFVSEAMAFKRLLGIAAAYLVIGFVIPFISGWGHLGGFLGGFALLCLAYYGSRVILEVMLDRSWG